MLWYHIEGGYTAQTVDPSEIVELRRHDTISAYYLQVLYQIIAEGTKSTQQPKRQARRGIAMISYIGTCYMISFDLSAQKR